MKGRVILREILSLVSCEELSGLMKKRRLETLIGFYRQIMRCPQRITGRKVPSLQVYGMGRRRRGGDGY
jgi:hypothetical protein